MQEKTRSEKIGTIVVIIIAIGCVAVLFFTTILPYIMSTSSGRNCSIHEPCDESKKEGHLKVVQLPVVVLIFSQFSFKMLETATGIQTVWMVYFVVMEIVRQNLAMILV